MDSLTQAIDALVELDQLSSGLMARRALVIDEARRLSESATDGSTRSSNLSASTSAPASSNATAASPTSGSPTSGSAKGWSARVIARRELVSSVACALRIPERTAENLIETSRTLVTELHATRAALTAGVINYRQAETIVDHAISLPVSARAEFENVMVDIAPALTNTQLHRRASRIRERMHPESITTRYIAALDRRCMDLSPNRDGMAWLSALLPAATATAAYNRITDIALNVEGAGESSTLTQLRADVLADLLVDGLTYDIPGDSTSHTAAGGRVGDAHDLAGTGRPVRTLRRGIGHGIRATVHVTVPVMTLLGVTDEPAHLDGHGPIDPDTARKLAAGAPSFHRILTHPETGTMKRPRFSAAPMRVAALG